MKFIIDAHLPKSIALFFNEHDVIHTSELTAGNRTKDNISIPFLCLKTELLSQRIMTSIIPLLPPVSLPG
jgi:hypothetical protein